MCVIDCAVSWYLRLGKRLLEIKWQMLQESVGSIASRQRRENGTSGDGTSAGAIRAEDTKLHPHWREAYPQCKKSLQVVAGKPRQRACKPFHSCLSTWSLEMAAYVFHRCAGLLRARHIPNCA